MSKWIIDYQLYDSAPTISIKGQIPICNIMCKYLFNYVPLSNMTEFQVDKVQNAVSVVVPADKDSFVKDPNGNRFLLENIFLRSPSKAYRTVQGRSQGELVFAHKSATNPDKRLFVSVHLEESPNTSDGSDDSYKILTKLSGYVNSPSDTSKHGKIVQFDPQDLIPKSMNYYLYTDRDGNEFVLFRDSLKAPKEYFNALLNGLGLSVRQYTNLLTEPAPQNPDGITIYYHGDAVKKFPTINNVNDPNVCIDGGKTVVSRVAKPSPPVPEPAPGCPTDTAPVSGPDPENGGKSFSTWEFVKFLTATFLGCVLAGGSLYYIWITALRFCWFNVDVLKRLIEKDSFYKLTLMVATLIYVLMFIFIAWNIYDIDNFWASLSINYFYLVLTPILAVIIWFFAKKFADREPPERTLIAVAREEPSAPPADTTPAPAPPTVSEDDQNMRNFIRATLEFFLSMGGEMESIREESQTTLEGLDRLKTDELKATTNDVMGKLYRFFINEDKWTNLSRDDLERFADYLNIIEENQNTLKTFLDQSQIDALMNTYNNVIQLLIYISRVSRLRPRAKAQYGGGSLLGIDDNYRDVLNRFQKEGAFRIPDDIVLKMYGSYNLDPTEITDILRKNARKVANIEERKTGVGCPKLEEPKYEAIRKLYTPASVESRANGADREDVEDREDPDRDIGLLNLTLAREHSDYLDEVIGECFGRTSEYMNFSK